MSDALASAAKLLAEPARAAMVLALMGGRALPAGELAATAHVSPQTASEHLARLTESGFLNVQQQGRHRYYALAAPEVADAVESLLVLSAGGKAAQACDAIPASGSLQHARTCYSHLAGWLGVRVTEALLERQFLRAADGRAFAVTHAGRTWFGALGVAETLLGDVPDARVAKQCIDWTQRRPHLAGALGVAMFRRFIADGWMVPAKKGRTVRITLEGRRALEQHLGVVVR